MPDFHHVFSKRADPRPLLAKLTPDDAFSDALKSAMTLVRAQLRREIRRLTEERFGRGEGVTPKFIIQGSQAYGTCNVPCHKPPQEIDVDLGVYVPVGHWDEKGLNPRRAAKEYFSIVEEALAPLVKDNGWRFGKPKSTCVRISISGLGAHIDVPLYAAPDNDFATLKESVLLKAALTMDARFSEAQFEEEDLSEDQWFEFTTVRLAMRDGTWKDSDPRKVTEWFEREVAREGGQQLRRVCRYLKSARDFYWKEGGPSSILLMVCASKVFKQFDQRDDLALAYVLSNIGPLLRGPVIEASISPTDDFNRVDEADRDAVAKWAQRSGAALSDVIKNARMTDLVPAFVQLQGVFGTRLPAAADLVYADTFSSGIRATPAAVVPQPQVRPTHAG